MAEEQKENQAQNGTQETRLPLSIDRSKEISKYMNVFNASFAYNEVFLEMGLGRVLDEAGKQVYSVRMNEVVSMTPPDAQGPGHGSWQGLPELRGPVRPHRQRDSQR